MKLVSIIVPCFDEEQTIYNLLELVTKVDLTELELAKEIIVVDDGSTDSSHAEIERFMRDHPKAEIKLISSKPNRGKGSAIREALGIASGEIILTQDADLEYSPSDYPLLLKPVVKDISRVVYGSRWLAPTIPISGPIYAVGGWLENKLLRTLYRTNITDIATGYKVFKTDLLKSLNVEAKGFEFCPEVTSKLLNRRELIVEVPISYKPRKKSEGKKIRWPDFFMAIYTILKVRCKRL